MEMLSDLQLWKREGIPVVDSRKGEAELRKFKGSLSKWFQISLVGHLGFGSDEVGTTRGWCSGIFDGPCN